MRIHTLEAVITQHNNIWQATSLIRDSEGNYPKAIGISVMAALMKLDFIFMMEDF